MSVTSKPMRDKKESAVISRERLRKQRGAVERYTAWVVLLISFMGSVAAFYGGWPALIQDARDWTVHAAPIAIGIGLQCLLTFLEWHYFDRPLVAWLARLADAVTTALGYGPLVVDQLAAQLTSQALPDAHYAAWAIIGLVSMLVAWYPESRLVD